MSTSPVPAIRTVWLVAGYIVWSIALVTLYAALSIGCEYGWHEMIAFAGISVQRLVLAALFLVAMAAASAALFLTWRRRQAARDPSGEAVAPSRFLESVSYFVALTALAATLVTLVPVFFLTACH